MSQAAIDEGIQHLVARARARGVPQAPPVPVPLVATSLVGDTNARAMGM